MYNWTISEHFLPYFKPGLTQQPKGTLISESARWFESLHNYVHWQIFSSCGPETYTYLRKVVIIKFYHKYSKYGNKDDCIMKLSLYDGLCSKTFSFFSPPIFSFVLNFSLLFSFYCCCCSCYGVFQPFKSTSLILGWTNLESGQTWVPG